MNIQSFSLKNLDGNFTLDCLFQIRKCEAGRGIICLPQCKYEGYSFSCLRGKCIWSKKGKDQFEKDLIPL